MKKVSRELKDSQEVGKRTICGTDYPVVICLEKVRNPLKSKPYWIVSRVCNQVADTCEKFSRKWEAEEYFLILTNKELTNSYNEEMTREHGGA